MEYNVIYKMTEKFRRKRMEQFVNKHKLNSETTILDVGGFSRFWKNSGVKAKITILRLEGPEHLGSECPSNIRSIQGDGCDLKEHADKSFDIVFSNSVIEHVGRIDRQKKFADEIARVGRGYWVQTPAMEFPIEPHVLTPFYHYLPRSLQERFFQWTVSRVLVRRRLKQYEIDELRAYLLTRAAMIGLFPDAEILTERFLRLPKSYVAWRQP